MRLLLSQALLAKHVCKSHRHPELTRDVLGMGLRRCDLGLDMGRCHREVVGVGAQVRELRVVVAGQLQQGLELAVRHNEPMVRIEASGAAAERRAVVGHVVAVTHRAIAERDVSAIRLSAVDRAGARVDAGTIVPEVVQHRDALAGRVILDEQGEVGIAATVGVEVNTAHLGADGNVQRLTVGPGANEVGCVVLVRDAERPLIHIRVTLRAVAVQEHCDLA